MTKKDLSFYNIKPDENIFPKVEAIKPAFVEEQPAIKKPVRGRPRTEEKKLNKSIAVYLNSEEYRKLKSKKDMKTISAYVKELIRKDLEK